VIVLVGFMGAGKSTVGPILANLVGLPFIDTDALVEARQGKSIPEIFQAGGEAAFRDAEREVALETLDGLDAVVSLGGGSLVDPKVCTALEGATVVHLRVSYGEAMRRLGSAADRPMLELRDPLTLARERERTYELVSEIDLETDGRSPRDIAVAIAVHCFGPEVALERPRRIAVQVPHRPYEVVVGRDLIVSLPDHLPNLDGVEQVVVVTQPSLRHLLADLVAPLGQLGRVTVELVEEGETAKSLSAADRLYGALAGVGFHRSDLIVSFGGGVVSDLAGFVASTYARGTRLVHVPTSLLAQVDAAIGGKTGVNLESAKNMVGTFYQPDGVICDVDLLASCPHEELRSGCAEIVKYGFVADPDLLEITRSHASKILGGDAPTLIDVISRSVGIKADVVARDERDSHSRAMLNYGHTFGHAIEQAMGYGGIRHGEAVAIGMMAAAYLARELGLATEALVGLHKEVLGELGLPATTDLALDDLESAWRLDKKYRGGVRFVLLKDVGRPVIGVEATPEALEVTARRLRS
jgi:3-dehydroquinate synthase/shikimate kinase/3-dehydroquinate synthase